MAPEKIEKHYPIYFQRSDGKGYNNEAENSEAVDANDDKVIRWRVVIGNHLKYQLAPPGDSKC